MDNGNTRCKIRKIEGLLHCGVSPAHHDKPAIAVKRTIARGAVGYAFAREFGLARYIEMRIFSAGRDDQGQCLVYRARRADLPGIVAFCAGLCNSYDVIVNDSKAELEGLLGKALNNLETADSIGKPGIILDEVSGRNKACLVSATDEQCIHIRPCCIDTCSKACRSASDNDHIIHNLKTFLCD